jgi:hypothetical protein
MHARKSVVVAILVAAALAATPLPAASSSAAEIDRDVSAALEDLMAGAGIQGSKITRFKP